MTLESLTSSLNNVPSVNEKRKFVIIKARDNSEKPKFCGVIGKKSIMVIKIKKIII